MKQKTYLTEDAKNLEMLENKYNFINFSSEINISVDDICLKKTRDIAKLKKRNISPLKLEILLKKYRDYAVNILD